MIQSRSKASMSREVLIPAGEVMLEGELNVPEKATGLVVFAHGSGSNRHSRRNQYVAGMLRRAGIGTLLFDMLTRKEDAIDQVTRRWRFDIELLASRLLNATRFVMSDPSTSHLRPAFFGASTGAAAALIAAAEIGDDIGAVVSRGGRSDLAGDALERVESPTLFLVGERDKLVMELNREAMQRITCKRELAIIPGATHMFDEPGALEEVADRSVEWFTRFV